jgi:hypothetical protein
MDDKKKDGVSRAVVAAAGAGEWGVVLWYRGPGIEREIEDVGLGQRIDSLGLFDAPIGVSVWEGDYAMVGSDMECRGEFRDPTSEEWVAIQRGESPWG